MRKMLIHRAAVGLLCMMSGCGAGKLPERPAAEQQQVFAAPKVRQRDSKPEEKPKPKVVEAVSSPIPPKGAQKTLLCKVYSGPNHVELTTRVKQDLVKVTGLKDWYVIHGESESTLYFGYYGSISDPKNPKERDRAKRDRQKISTMQNREGEHPFRGALFVDIDAPEPEAPPEWNLANKDKDKPADDPTKAYWSLQVAAYLDSPERKQAAVDSVKEMRANGIEAYYFHGPTISSVTIGAWPKSAAIDEGREEIASKDPERPLAVVNAPIDVPDRIRTRDGEMAEAKVPRVHVFDQTLAELMQKYPRHAVNGEYLARTVRDPATGREVRKPDVTFLVTIPTAPDDEAEPDGANPRTIPDELALPGRTGRGSGLRRLED